MMWGVNALFAQALLLMAFFGPVAGFALGYWVRSKKSVWEIPMNKSTLARIINAESSIKGLGYELRYEKYIEDSHYPGILGYYGGITDRQRKVVKIKIDTRGKIIAERLEHELHHITDPEWDCGNRPVFRREM